MPVHKHEIHRHAVHRVQHILNVFCLKLVEGAWRMCGSVRPGHRNTHRRRVPLRRLGFHTSKSNTVISMLMSSSCKTINFALQFLWETDAMENCDVLSESGTTTSISPICSFGSSLTLNTIRFSPTLSSSTATLTAPLVYFTPKPSEEGQPGVGSCDISNIDLDDLAFHGTAMFEIETSDRISFVPESLTEVTNDCQQGTSTTLKAQSFKQQIPPSFWQSDMKTTDLPDFNGGHISIDEKGQVETQLPRVLAHLSFFICSESWNRVEPK
ncbi:hypothetical protein BLNAU_17127 [Blattamonas nauphoetae]|uniref:Uncharacterized protein n=1 Tax=Blattamonas nauphoetae TaxID=2049346 RepID=A0ABQ9X9B4_9EUKA|nr:hypothetical protein BLNAU_17127 [Blattamonas nauphoetae]